MKLYQISEPETQTVAEENDLIVGIDFGTTNSLIAYHDDNDVKVIPCGDNSCIVPSVVSYVEGKAIVGKKALEQRDTIRSVKRLMGKGIKDLDTIHQHNIDHQNSSDNIVKLTCHNKKNISPVEVSSEILKYLKKNAESHIGQEIQKVVITVPAHFDEAARIATRDAAKIAGLEVIRIINEPTAAAIAYGLDTKPDGYFLVYDLGGGTFDVSILKMQGGIVRVIATYGDNNLGGDDFDMELLKLISNKMNISFEKLQNKTSEYLASVSQIKHHLSNHNTWKVNFHGKEISIARAEVEKVWRNLIDQTINIVREALYSAKLKSGDISHIMLVGGATRIPAVNKAVSNFFNKKPLNHIDPDKVVVIGAALQARALMTSNHLLIDVVPLSLGIELLGGIVETIIPRNTPIPAVVHKTYTTYVDDQTGFKIHVIQGEGENITQCRSLGRFELKGLTPKPAGELKLDVCFRFDADGLLTVSATEVDDGKTCSIEIKPSYGLTEDEMRRLITAV